MLNRRHGKERDICGAHRYVTTDERGRLMVFHVATLDVVAAHLRLLGWFTMRRLVLVHSFFADDVPAKLASARAIELSRKRQRFDPGLFTGEWSITYYGDPLEMPPYWIDIAVCFRRGGQVMFTVQTYDCVAMDLAEPERSPDDGYYVDLLVVERIDPELIHGAVSSIVSAGLLSCGVLTTASEAGVRDT